MESHYSISRPASPEHSSSPSPSDPNNNSTNPLLVKEVDDPSANVAASSAPSIVKQATVGLTLYTIVGVVVYVVATESFKGTTTFVPVDGLYFTVVTLCTVGYGDVVPRTGATKLFACGLDLVGFGFVGIALNALLAHVLDQQEQAALLASDTGSWALAAYVVDARKGRMRVRVKAGLAVGVVLACVAVGTVMVRVLERLGWIDSFYLAVTSVTTVGYGDYAFATLWGRLFAAIWLPLSTVAVARAFLYLMELRMEKRARRTAERVLKRQLTAGDAAAADLDGNGSIREPLLPIKVDHPIHRRRPSLSCSTPTSSTLCPLPEDGEISLPISSTSASSLKDRLIFGLPSADDDFTDVSSINSCSSPHPTTPVPSSPGSNPFSALAAAADAWLTDPSAGRWKSNLHRCRTAPAMSVINDVGPSQPASPNRPSIIGQAFLLLVIYLSFGVAVYTFNRHHFNGSETHPVVDALYFCIVTMCTIGYGDITPATASAKIFSIMFVIVGFGFVDILLSGMVSYVLDLQESLLLSAVTKPEKVDKSKRQDQGNSVHHHQNGHDIARNYIIDVKKGRMRIRMKVALALCVVLLCVGLGTGILRFVERLGWIDSFYLSVMSVTTVGYGDQAFRTLPGRLFASVWLLVSTLAVARAFLYLAEARIDKRHRTIAKWVLCRDMTISEFLAADIDNNGYVTKSEYVIYKLKEMGKVSDKDIMQICNQFDKLDSGKCGKITLSDLIDSHHGHS